MSRIKIVTFNKTYWLWVQQYNIYSGALLYTNVSISTSLWSCALSKPCPCPSKDSPQFTGILCNINHYISTVIYDLVTIAHFWHLFLFKIGQYNRYPPSQSLIAPPPSSQPRDYPLAQLQRIGRGGNWDKTNIRVGSFMTVKVRDIEEKTREGKTRSTRKELVACVQKYALQLPSNSISLLLSAYLYANLGYCRFFGCLVAFGVQKTPIQTISCGSLLTKK